MTYCREGVNAANGEDLFASGSAIFSINTGRY